MWLDTEMTFRAPTPDDILQTGVIGRMTQYYEPYDARLRETNELLNNNELLRYILRNSDIQVSLQTIGNAFFPRTITIGTTPTEIIAPNRTPRGYILINPNTTVSGVVTTVTVFPAATVFPVGVTNSASINVSGHGEAAFIMDITEATAGPMTVDLQSQDPISGNWVTVQADIFGGVVAVGTYHADVGSIGIDQSARLVVTVAGDSFTGSIAALLKPQLAGTVAGATVFIGNNDVNTTIGFPLLGGAQERFQLRENTPLFGIAVAATDVRLFELQ